MNTSNTFAIDLSQLDAVTVQSGGLRKLDDGTYASTLYTDVDDFGMLGGYMRVRAAQELYRRSPDMPFVFCNGRSAKQIAKFGPDVPTDAEIYAKEFQKGLDIPASQVFLEDKSVNTIASIAEIFSICARHGWKHIGLVSSDYHLPRIKALCGLIFEKLGTKPVEITFLSAEATVKQLRPGVFGDEIDAAYATPAGKERIKNEQNGCEDIAAGRYHIGEFQLVL